MVEFDNVERLIQPLDAVMSLGQQPQEDDDGIIEVDNYEMEVSGINLEEWVVEIEAEECHKILEEMRVDRRSTPITFPSLPTIWAAMYTSRPAPQPKSKMVIPWTSSGICG